jgi:hypothetical protein
MVNPTELTVKKLSKLQKIIISKLALKEGGSDALVNLARDTALEFKPKKGSNFNFSKDFGKVVFGDPTILENKFKASFYRSIKRLKKRELIENQVFYYEREADKKRIYVKGLKLTEKGRGIT